MYLRAFIIVFVCNIIRREMRTAFRKETKYQRQGERNKLQIDTKQNKYIYANLHINRFTVLLFDNVRDQMRFIYDGSCSNKDDGSGIGIGNNGNGKEFWLSL